MSNFKVPNTNFNSKYKIGETETFINDSFRIILKLLFT